MEIRRYILTGTPGAGKTSIAHALRTRGHHVVDEAATDVIMEAGGERPWEVQDFVDLVVHRQHQRQRQAGDTPVQVFDRSPLCTLALARYSGLPTSPALAAELDRIERERVYQRKVLLVQPIGFVTRTVARRIDYANSLLFARIHEEVYAQAGYDLIEIPPAPIPDRVALVEEHLR